MSSSSGESSLGEAVDSFLEWARASSLSSEVGELPAVEGRIGIGTRLDDFELVRQLGSGGMGVVFEARQLSVPGRRVAVKVLRNPFASNSLVQRFQREITSIGAMEHPGIVPVLAAGHAEGFLYYAMHFVDGVPASSVVQELRSKGGPPSMTAVRRHIAAHTSAAGGGERSVEDANWPASYENWVARLGLRVAEALDHAHGRGVVHRDVKPGNVMIRADGEAVLVDFGLAANDSDDSLTRTGSFVGTLAFAAPEQLKGRQVDARSDVYSLGATLYTLLGLRPPFEARSQSELLSRIETDEPLSLGQQVPTDLRTIVLCALAKSPDRRFARASAMADDLRSFLDGRPIRARLPGPITRALHWARRHPRLATLMATALVLTVGLRLRDHAAARRRVQQGLEYTRAWQAEESRRGATLDELVELRSRSHELAFWGDGVAPDMRRVVQLEEELEHSSERLRSLFLAREDAYRGAFEHVAGHAPARRGLAALYAGELARRLREYDDLLQPVTIEELEGRLSELSQGEYALLLDPRGSFRLESEPAGALVTVHRLGSQPERALPVDAPTPLDLSQLAEGSYLALLRAPGYGETRYPFLVRRRACYDEPSAKPPREARVELLPEGALPDGFVHVPAGWTLVEDDPPVWRQVGSFVMQRREVSYADWIEHLDRLPEIEGLSPQQVRDIQSDPTQSRPRWSDHPEASHVFWDEPSGRWLSAPEVDPSWPVRGLPRNETHTYLAYLRQQNPRELAGWSYSLPSDAEWVRAARGADARPYPWGQEFDWSNCGAFYSTGEGGHEPRPYPTQSFSKDVSPFGLVDLAGSVRELTFEAFGSLRARFSVRGGSFRTAQRSRLRVTAVAGVWNKPVEDVGFRFVARPRPDWMGADATAPTEIHDDFERASGARVGVPWIEIVGNPLHARWSLPTGERVFLEDGRAVCAAGRGNGSEYAWLLRPVRDLSGSAGQFPSSATLKLELELHEEAETERNYFVGLFGDFSATPRLFLGVSISSGGLVQLEGPPLAGEVAGHPTARLTPALPHWLEITYRPDGLELRTWSPGEPRPDAPLATRGLPAERAALRYLGVSAPNYIGGRMEVEELHWAPLD